MLGYMEIDLRTIDRLNLLIPFFIFYGCVSAAMRYIVVPPKDLDKGKEYHDFFGQHVSFCHSLVATILAIAVYVYEGGIHYNSESNYMHDFVLGV